ncbi:MAG: autotransporter domain-containing protein [Alphaproteobacteria bacterium]
MKFNNFLMSIFIGSVFAFMATHAEADVTTYFTVSDDDSHSVETWSLSNSYLGNSTTAGNLGTGGYVYNYVVEYFTPTTSGTYKMGQILANVDTVMLVYENSFDPTSPATNFLAFNDDGNQSYFPTTPSCRGSSGLCPAFQTELEADTDYYIVISTFSPGTGLTLPQEFFVTGVASVGIGGEPAADPPPSSGPLVLDGSGTEGDSVDLDDRDNEVRFDDGDDVTADLSFDSDTEFDTQDNDGVVSGDLTGNGKLIKTGNGDLTLTGTNTQAGTLIQEGTVIASSDSALGAAGSDLELDGGTLETAAGFTTLARDVDISANNGTLNTGSNDITASGTISGVGKLIKTGTGDLTLTGTNTQAGTLIQEGTVVASSDNALGAAGSDLELDGGTLETAAGFTTLARDVDISANNGTLNTGSNDVTASGTISGVGKLIKAGTGGLTLTGTNTYTGTLIQEGSLIVSSDSALGTSTSSLEFDGGTLTAGTDFTIGRDIEVSGNDGTIDTNGNDVTASGNVSGTGCLVKDGSGKLIMSGLVANSLGACIQQGVLALNGSITGGAIVQAGGTLQGSGTIGGSITVYGNLSPGNSPGILISVGSVVQAVGSTLDIDVDGTGTGIGAGNYDRLLVTGVGSTYTADGELKPILRGITGLANNNFTPEIGDTFDIVEANGGILGEFATLTQPGSGLASGTRFDIIYGDTVISLVVTPTSFTSLPNLKLSGNESEAGKALDQIRPSAGAAIADSNAKYLFDNLSTLDETHMSRALRQITGENKTNSMAVAGQARAETSKVVATRLAGKRNDFKTSAVSPQAEFDLSEETSGITKDIANNILGLSPDNNVWGKVFGKHSKTGADDNALGYTARTFGVVIGGDTKISPKLMTGLAISNMNTELDSEDNGSGRVESWQLLGYSSYTPTENYYIDSSVGFSIDRYRESRIVSLAGGDQYVYGTSSGYSLLGDVEGGKSFITGYGFIVPFVGLRLEWMKQNAFVENGSAAVAMHYFSQTVVAPQTRIGFRTNTEFKSDDGLDGELRARIAWLRDIGNGYYDHSEARLHNTTIRTYPANPGKNALDLATGFSFGEKDNMIFNIDYEAELRENRTSHGVSVGVKYSW